MPARGRPSLCADRPSLPRRTAALAAGLALLLVAASVAQAHDFWLIPNALRISSGDAIEVRGQTSSRFPTSESAVGPERVADARILSAAGETPIRDLSVSGTSLLVRLRPTSPGQRVVALTLHPRSVRESPDGFREYLVLEGAPEALERYQREGRLPTDSITRQYAKYAKTLVEVGSGGPRAYSRVAGHPAEFVPLADPAGLTPGDTLPVRLLYRGSPLAHAHVHAGSVPSAGSGEEERAVTVETDGEGIARLVIDRPGLWNVRALHIVPADRGSGADWDTHWVTLVFRVEGIDRPGAGVRADSAAVAAIVERFHGALAAGDSATALALLTPDALVLESGGLETKEEYRAHHLPADISFARTVATERGPLRVTVRGDAAWAASTSVARGTFRDRAVNSQTAELMVLVRTAEGWRISAIHWSSRNLRS